MSSFDVCVPKVAAKLPDQVKKALTESVEPDRVLDEYIATISREKREAAFQAVRLSDAVKDVSKHPDGPFYGMMAMLTKDNRGAAGYKNVEFLGRYYNNLLQSKNAKMLERFRAKGLGFLTDEENLQKFVRAIYGETTDDAVINAAAKDWLETTELIRQLKNRNGAAISKNDRFLMPQHHDARAVQNAGKETWVNYMKREGVLDRTRMLDDAGNPLSDKQLDDLLNYSYESITTHGLNKLDELAVPRLGRKLSRRGSERRILYFKTAESYISYQKDFGKGDLFSIFTDYLEASANDIALLERMGPNPNDTYKAMFAYYDKQKLLTTNQKKMMEATFNVVSGKTNQGEITTSADFFQGFRNVITASTLGSAFLSSISDVGFQTLTAKMNGLPAMKILMGQLRSLAPGDIESQRIAAQIGLGAEAWITRTHASNRYGDVYGTGMTAKVAEGVMRASLLKPWTDGGRKSFTIEFAGLLGRNFGKKFDELDPNLIRAMKTYDITEADWAQFRRTTLLEHNGGVYADMTQPGGKKFHQMIMSEVDYAVPTPDARVRAITTGGLQRGTVSGEAWRSAFMIKSFPLTIATTHFYRAGILGSSGFKPGYFGSLLATTWALGAIALQAKDIAKGKDPRPMNTPEFWAAALQQGGGLGIMGDFIFSDVNRFGGGITETLTGPAGELLDTSVKFTLGNFRELVQGEETHILKEANQILERYTPSTWQVHLLKQSLFDQLEMMADPDAEKKYRRLMRKEYTEYNRDYWWRPGEMAPRRAPDLENITED